MSESSMQRVLLLRAPAEDGPDRYEAEFEARGYAPLSVPVLETVIVHLDALTDKIVRGPNAQRLSGVIMTSKRAVETWCQAIRSIPQGTVQADWRTVPFYVVGDATAAAASKMQTAFPSLLHLTPADVRGGPQSGTAERLAHFILADAPSHDGGARRKLLYLTGDKNRDTLPQLLSAGHVELDTLEVYRTTGSSSFRGDLRSALERASVGEYPRSPRPLDPLTSYSLAVDATDWGWVVYFAPSAAEFVTPFLSQAFRLRGRADAAMPALKIAAIGPTTASFLRDTLKLQVDVVSPKPTPGVLASAIVAFDNA